MRLWTYHRPFQHNNEDFEVKLFFSFTSYTSQLFREGVLVDESKCSLSEGGKVVKLRYQSDDAPVDLTVSVGYFSWWNVGIEVRENDELLYASHPGSDLYFAENKLANMETKAKEKGIDDSEQRKQKWQRNKHSIFADIFLGIAFFVTAKVSDDLTTAAFVGVSLGLALVVIQRFVKVDLLGGFAVFGTIMLLISALFSLAFQSEYLVQLKGTFMGLLGASILLVDGIFRDGRYFGSRFERFLSHAVDHKRFVTGLGIISACMSVINYSIATYATKDFWLTYSTFLDLPIYIVLFMILTSFTKPQIS